MATKRKRILRMLEEGYSQRDIACALHCSRRDVSQMAAIKKDSGIPPEALAEMTEDDLRQLVAQGAKRESNYVMPDLDYVASELKKPGVTRKLLWYEYGNTTAPDGMVLYQYAAFCRLLDRHLEAQGATMHLTHEPGRCLFVDWAGDTMSVRDRITGTDIKVFLFVASLPYSGYIYAEGFTDVTQRSWLAAHEHTFAALGGVPYILVPDNCATAVDRSPIYVTEINDTYMAFAEHYDTAIVPTRRRRPKDKAVVEGAVGICERWVIAALRNQTFFTLCDLNEAIAERADWLNERPFKEKDGSRITLFLDEEQHCLKPLPATRYELFDVRRAKVGHDYHVQIDYMRYSVDYHLIKQTVECHISDNTVKIYHSGALIACHKRLYGRRGQYCTSPEHMPPNHRHYDSSYSPERFRKWAANIGSATATVIDAVLASRTIIEQAFVPCANILGLSKKGRAGLLERACARIVADNMESSATYTRVKNLMEAMAKADSVAGNCADDDVTDADDAQSGIGRTRGSGYYRRDKECGDDLK